MDDEFKLCWKNFQDNIASGFQNLYDRGDLVDVTLACDGKLLHAHKIVLAICSPYFQEIFITNPCKHPIIILKDVSFNIMCELLEFMYQGVVNVKHTELQSFMKIGQLLQIKGLATNISSSAASTTSEKSINQLQNSDENVNNCNDTGTSGNNTRNNNEQTSSIGENSNTSKGQNALAGNKNNSSPSSSPIPLSFTSPITPQNFKNTSHDSNASHQQQHSYHGGAGFKRHSDFTSDALSIYSRKQLRRSLNTMEHSNDHNESSEGGSGIDQVNNDDFYLHSIPHISMVESRYDLHNVKREGEHLGGGAPGTTALRNSFGQAFGFDYNLYKNNNPNNNTGTEYPNELHIPSDYSKNFGNHMDIPPIGNNIVMLSSTSLLHGNCVFNRNNTVATQQGMKTYWLCKSYRISMCRARCITHQGRVISATGSHNHPPHMRNGCNNTTASNNANSNGTGSGTGSGTAIGTVAGPGIGNANNNNNNSNNNSSSNSNSNNNSNNNNNGNDNGNNNNNNNNSGIATTGTVTGTNTNTTTGHIGGNFNVESSVQNNSAHTANTTVVPSTGSIGNNLIAAPSLNLNPANLRFSQPPVPNIYQHSPHHPPNIQSHHTQSQQHLNSPHIATTAVPASNSLTTMHSHGHHLGPPLIPQHPMVSVNHQHGASVSQHLNLSGPQIPQTQHGPNSVIHNMMHNANLMHLSNMPHMLHVDQDSQLSPHLVGSHNQHHQSQSTGHQQNVGANLEITRLIQSSPRQMQSPSNRSCQSHHGGGNSISSPLPANNVGITSPAQSNINDDAHMGNESTGLQSNHTISPSDMNSSTTGSTEVVATVQPDNSNDGNHQAHVIDSITISPGNNNFKIENM